MFNKLLTIYFILAGLFVLSFQSTIDKAADQTKYSVYEMSAAIETISLDLFREWKEALD